MKTYWGELLGKTVYGIPELDGAEVGDVVTFVDKDSREEFSARYSGRNTTNDMRFTRWSPRWKGFAQDFIVFKTSVEKKDDEIVLDTWGDIFIPGNHTYTPSQEFRQKLVDKLGRPQVGVEAA